jgi:hypothetical protein
MKALSGESEIARSRSAFSKTRKALLSPRSSAEGLLARKLVVLDDAAPEVVDPVSEIF